MKSKRDSFNYNIYSLELFFYILSPVIILTSILTLKISDSEAISLVEDLFPTDGIIFFTIVLGFMFFSSFVFSIIQILFLINKNQNKYLIRRLSFVGFELMVIVVLYYFDIYYLTPNKIVFSQSSFVVFLPFFLSLLLINIFYIVLYLAEKKFITSKRSRSFNDLTDELHEN